MENKFNAKQCVFILILIVVALYCISWMSGSLDMSSMLGSEQFNGNSNVPVDSSGIDSGTSSKTVSGPSDDDQNDKVSPKTGTMIDGPGFDVDVSKFDQLPDATTSIPSNYYFLDDGASGEMSIQHNLCSKSCCSEQWPTPFKNKYDPYVCGSKQKFYPSNYFCNNSFQDAGCACLSAKQTSFLYNRGGNGREWF